MLWWAQDGEVKFAEAGKSQTWRASSPVEQPAQGGFPILRRAQLAKPAGQLGRSCVYRSSTLGPYRLSWLARPIISSEVWMDLPLIS